MISFYRRLRMRHGLCWFTGQPRDWAIYKDCILVFAFFALLLVVLDSVFAAQRAQERLAYVESKLELREQQLVSCLNGGAVGYVTLRDRTIYTVCQMAEEIDVGRVM